MPNFAEDLQEATQLCRAAFGDIYNVAELQFVYGEMLRRRKGTAVADFDLHENRYPDDASYGAGKVYSHFVTVPLAPDVTISCRIGKETYNKLKKLEKKA